MQQLVSFSFKYCDLRPHSSCTQAHPTQADFKSLRGCNIMGYISNEIIIKKTVLLHDYGDSIFKVLLCVEQYLTEVFHINIHLGRY